MKVLPSGVHLAYCMNVHPGDAFADQVEAVRTTALPLRERLGWTGAFGLGLHLGQAAAVGAVGAAGDAFCVWCRDQNLYPFTINGFPFGNFHRAPVKANVYRPDWSTPARRDYTMQLADLLAGWLPDGVGGSISTVPLGFRADQPGGAAVTHLVHVARHLGRIEADTGRRIVIGLEPEPWCKLERFDDVLRFFRDQLWPVASADEMLVRRHIGVCVDTCHCALAFESPARVLRALVHEGILVAKVQLSAALRLTPEAGFEDDLAPFNEPVYFHQVAARGGGRQRTWVDLPEALPALRDGRDWEEARVHFHVPLDWAGQSRIGSTRDNMDCDFWHLLREGICPHVEIETYTFHVLPPALAGRSLLDHLEAEFRWVLGQFHSAVQVTTSPP